MNLDTTTKLLQIVLGEAKTTHDCNITSSWADSAVSSFTLGNTNTNSNGVTPVTVVGPPASLTQRQVKEVRLFNNDTVTHTVTLQLFDGANTWVISPADQVVAPGGTFVYTPEATTSTNVILAQILAVMTTGINVSPSPNVATLAWQSDAAVSSGTYTFTQYAPLGGSITSLQATVGPNGGSLTATVEINGTPVVGIDGVTVNTGATQSFVATGDNVYSVGATITLVLVVASGNPAGAAFSLVLG